jgi:hypothetical protein
VPEGLAAVVVKMMAKKVEDRYQTPAEVYKALAPWAPDEVPPPAEAEMPRLCPRSQGPGSTDPGLSGRSTAPTMVQPRTPRPGPAAPVEEPTAITARTGAPKPKTKKTPKAAEPASPSRPPKWLIPAAVAGAAVLLLALGALGLWLALRDRREPVAVAPHSGGERPADTSRHPTPPGDTGRGPAQPPAGQDGVVITAEGNGRRIRTPKYEAVIADDGNMTSLKVGGVEFFKSGLKFGNWEARGAYVFEESGLGVLPLAEIEQGPGHVVTARGDPASVRHEFGPSSIRWTVSNRSDYEQRFYIVFDKNVRAVTDGKGQWAEAPARVPPGAAPDFQVAHDWPDTSWFAGKNKLTLTGGTRIWGQWPTIQDNYQVWQLTLPPHEVRKVSVAIGEATPEEEAGVAAVTGTGPAPAPAADGVTIKADKDRRHVLAPKYEARIDADGCVTSLKVAGVELLRPGIDVSRGAYFHQEVPGQKPVPTMPTVEQPSANVVTAKGDRCSARYEFHDDGMTWTVSNATDKRMNFFLVFTTAVASVTNGTETVPTPAVKDWPTTTWDFGKGKLKITGGTRIWGPWPSPKENSQVWHADLNPHETRKVTIQLLGVADRAAGVSLQSPHDYQVFQRRTKKAGEVPVRGTAPAGCDAVEARLSGTSLDGPLSDRWQPLYPAANHRDFSATLPTPAGGWYKLEVRALRDKKVVAETAVDHVGVGEVFVIAGQSNAANSGEEAQRATSHLVSSFAGDDWRPADDPQPGVNDGSSGGSPWPVFGDALATKYKVPIGIASTGRGGTSVHDWRPDGDLFRFMTRRMEALGPHGFRAVLWHQGEADFATPADAYARGMTDIIHASQKAAGWDVPWFVAQVSYQSPAAPASESTRAGQKKLWDTKVALEGPDTDALRGDNRDQGGKGIHFSGKGLRAHGKLWADKVGAYLDKIVAE